MKRQLSIFLIALMVMTVLIPCQAALAVNSEYFETIEIDGVKYYDMLGSNPSSFNSGPDTFFKDYLQIQTTQGSTTYPSVMEEWSQVAEAILAGASSDAYTTKWDKYKNASSQNPMEKSFSGVGTANSIDAAAKAAVDMHNSMRVPSGCEAYHLMNPTGLDNSERKCVFFVKHGFPKYQEGLLTAANGSYVVIFSDFQIAQVVSDGYIKTNVMDTENYKLTQYDPTSVNAQVFTNDTLEPSQATATLSTNVSETTTLTTTDSYQYSESKSWNIGGKLMIGNKDWYGGGEISGGFSQSWSSVTGKSFANGKAQSSGTTNTSTLSAALPPYTEATVIQSKGKGAMNIKIDLPVAVSYNVAIIYLCSFKIDNQLDSVAAYYRGATGRNSTDARDDLYQRVKNSAAEPDEVNNTTETMKTLAEKIYSNIPLSKANTGFDYQLEYTQSRLSNVRPMKNLQRVELKEKRTNMVLNVDEPLDVSTVQVVGLNDASAPYFGFDDALGSWILTDTSGNPISGNANEYIKLADDAATGKTLLTALKPGGTVILKYQVPAGIYIDVKQTPVGAKQAEIVYIDPKDVTNQATIIVKTTANTDGYRMVADGEVIGCVGDAAIDLDGDNSPVSAYALDPDGLQTTVPITWVAQLSNGTVSIDADNVLTFQNPGENRIRAQWGNVHSDWLPVTVKEQKKLATLTLSDPGRLLETWRWSDSATSRSYDLTGLKLQCLDQFDEPMTAPDDLVWYVSKDGADAAKIDDPKAFTVTGPGVYALSVKSADGSIASNALSLTVEEAPRPAVLTLADDEYEPLLQDYILHDGDDTFDLTKLTVTAIDQYGDDCPVDATALNWTVNGKALNNNVLTVDTASTYTIRCRLAGGPQSNALTLKVQPARVPTALTLADDEYDPLLADYILGDGSDTFDLSKLTLSAVDQYGDDYATDNPTWLVNGADNGGATLTVTEARIYDICFTLAGTQAQSNALTLNVKAARHLYSLSIADDPVSPMLEDYRLGSGSDQFDLFMLVIEAKDQYGASFPFDDISFYANGTLLPDGVLTVDKVGEYTIMATATDGDLIAESNTLTLKVVPRITGVRLSVDSLTLSIGERHQLTATALPEGERDTYTYTSSRTTVVSASDSGLITANAQGTAVITVTGATGCSAQCTVKVVGQPESVTLSPSEMLLGMGESSQLSVQILPANSSTTLSFRSSDIDIVRVSPEGRVTGVSEGSAIIRVETHNGLSDECYVKVVGAPAGINAPDSLVLGLKETYDLAANTSVALGNRARNAKAIRVLTYRSMDPTVVSVSETGAVTALKLGETAIAVSTFNGITRSIPVVVMNAPTGVKVDPKKATLDKTDRLQLTAILPEDCAGACTFKSSNAKVASVTADGMVVAKKKGKATITVRTYNGKKAKCTITCTGRNPIKLKLKKSIDMTRPDSTMLICPTVKNDWQSYTLTITAKKGKKNFGDVTDCFAIVQTDNMDFELRHLKDKPLPANVKCTAVLTVDQGYRTIKASKSFTLKRGKVKATINPTAVILDKSIPTGYAQAMLTIADATVAPISDVVKDSSCSGKYTVQYLGEGVVRVSFTDAKPAKQGETLKLKVYVEGCRNLATYVNLKVKLGRLADNVGPNGLLDAETPAEDEYALKPDSAEETNLEAEPAPETEAALEAEPAPETEAETEAEPAPEAEPETEPDEDLSEEGLEVFFEPVADEVTSIDLTDGVE